MKTIITIKKDGEELNFFNHFPQEIKNETFTYFIEGQGYKKTKRYTVKEVDLPDMIEMPWLEICKIYDRYGYYVAVEYAKRKTCGEVAKNKMRAYYQLYNRAKDILLTLPDSIQFFEALPVDTLLMLAFGYGCVDILQFDKNLSDADPLYNSHECTYNGKKCSLNDYIALKYSPMHAEAIRKML